MELLFQLATGITHMRWLILMWKRYRSWREWRALIRGLERMQKYRKTDYR